jgi:hypothetical protein
MRGLLKIKATDQKKISQLADSKYLTQLAENTLL